MDNMNDPIYGDDFDYFDEYPEDDPFLPKKNCDYCGGSGEKLSTAGERYTCPKCNGVGVII